MYCLRALIFIVTPLLGESFLLEPTRNTLLARQRKTKLQYESDGTDGLRTNAPQFKDVKAHNSTFQWYKNWYPIVAIEILDPEIPHHFQLLGMDLVIWKDAKVEDGTFQSKKQRSRKKNFQLEGGEWRVFQDSCSHRLAPLSEGRAEDDGTLFCSYHGWRFDGEGRVVDIPQLDQSGVDAVRRNPKSQCQAFPTQVIDGILWVWPEAGDDARLQAALNTQPNKYELRMDDVDEDNIWRAPWMSRELPFSFDVFLENGLDSAHVPVTHHGKIGSRYDNQTMNMDLERPLTQHGFAVRSYNAKHYKDGIVLSYNAPCSVSVESKLDVENSDGLQVLELYASPSRPGFCNMIQRQILVKPKEGIDTPSLRFVKFMTMPIPKALSHLIAHSFLVQDAAFLHKQERAMAHSNKYSAVDKSEALHNWAQVVLPVNTDLSIVYYRRWLNKFAGGFIPYKGNPPMPEVNLETCYDTWAGHTSKCQYCQGAVKKLKRARFASYFITIILTTLRPAKHNVFNLAGSLIAAAIGLGLNKVIGMYHRTEFSHAHND